MKQRTKQASSGFTLLEVVIVMTILTIMTYLVVSALPPARVNQRLESDVQQFRSLISRAQQLAVNEVRPDSCLARAGANEETQRRCSNVGVVARTGELVLFADLDGDRRYSGPADFEIEKIPQTADVNDGREADIVFEADPPEVFMYADSRIIGAGQSYVVRFAIGEATRTFSIGPYGVISDAQ